jgi:hypothetical protein
MLAGEQVMSLVRLRVLKDNIVVSTSCDVADVVIDNDVSGSRKH